MSVEALWIYYLTELRAHMIETCERPLLEKFNSFLMDRGINFSPSRERGRNNSLVKSSTDNPTLACHSASQQRKQ